MIREWIRIGFWWNVVVWSIVALAIFINLVVEAVGYYIPG